MRKILLATVFCSMATLAIANPTQVNSGAGPVSQAQVYGNGSSTSQTQQTKSSVGNVGSTSSVGDVNGSSHNNNKNTVVVNGVGNTNNNGANGGLIGGPGLPNFPVSSAIAPSFGGGMNGCSGTAASLAGQFQLFGASLGGTNMDNVCEAMRLGEVDVAREVECNDSRSFRHAAYNIGRPCSVDRERWEKEHPVPPVVNWQPVLDELAQITPKSFVPVPWCKGASKKARLANPLSCGVK